jgi:Zn-dependent protease
MLPDVTMVPWVEGENMKLHIGTFSGVPLYLHWSWFVFLGILALLNGFLSIVILLMVFFLVVLHEYGHCWAAQWFGVEVRDVTLYPVGGVASMRFNHGEAKQEIVIALAGPAVNIVLFILSGIGAYIAYLLQQQYLLLVGIILCYFNAVLAIFNLLPIFPMDGGRVLRGILTKCIGDYEKATWWVVRVGQCLCVVMIGVGIWVANPLFVLIFCIMALAAQHELLAAKQFACLVRIRERLAEGLNRPELKNVTVPEVIAVLEDVSDDQTRQRFYYDELVPLLKDLEESHKQE